MRAVADHCVSEAQGTHAPHGYAAEVSLCLKHRRSPALGRLPLVPRLVDTTIRLLSQEPLAGRLPTGELLGARRDARQGRALPASRSRAAASSTTAVRRGVESPWERIRALEGPDETPLGLALRGASSSARARSAVGLRAPASSPRPPRTASTSSACTTRSTTSRTCARPARRSSAPARSSTPGLVYSPGDAGAMDRSSSSARGCPSSRRRASSSTIRPAALAAAPGARARRDASARRAGCPSASTARARAAAALADALEAARAGADLIAAARSTRSRCSLHRVAGESLAYALAGIGLDTGVDVDRALGGIRPRRRAHRRRARRAARAPRRRAGRRVRPADRASSRRSTRTCARNAAGDRCSRTLLEELAAIRARGRLAAARGPDRPDPRLAGADPRSLGAPLRHGRRRVPDARQGGTARRPAPIDAGRRSGPSRSRRTACRSTRTRRPPRTCAQRPKGSPRARRSSS